MQNENSNSESEQEINNEVEFKPLDFFFHSSFLRQLYSNSSDNFEQLQSLNYFSIPLTDDLEFGIRGSRFWKEPQSMTQINLRLFGVQLKKKLHHYRQLKKYYYFDYSNDGKYFIFINYHIVYIIDCHKGWLIKKIKYKQCPTKLTISEDSQYLLVQIDKDRNDSKISENVKVYVYDIGSLQRVLKKHFYMGSLYSCEGFIDFSIKWNLLYVFYVKKAEQRVNIYNLLDGQSQSFPTLLSAEEITFDFIEVRFFPIHHYLFIHNLQAFQILSEPYSLGCFLYNKNGKILKIMRNYTNIEYIYGLEINTQLPGFFIYRLYNIQNGKLLKKIMIENFPKSEFRYRLYPNVKMTIMKNDILIQQNLSEDFFKKDPNKFYTVEFFCLRFRRRRCYYQGLKQINKTRAFEIEKKDVIKFYLF